MKGEYFPSSWQQVAYIAFAARFQPQSTACAKRDLAPGKPLVQCVCAKVWFLDSCHENLLELFSLKPFVTCWQHPSLIFSIEKPSDFFVMGMKERKTAPFRGRFAVTRCTKSFYCLCVHSYGNALVALWLHHLCCHGNEQVRTLKLVSSLDCSEHLLNFVRFCTKSITWVFFSKIWFWFQNQLSILWPIGILFVRNTKILLLFMCWFLWQVGSSRKMKFG